MKYITKYLDGGDTIKMITIDENGNENFNEIKFFFRGFVNGIHPFFTKQIEWIEKILNDHDIKLNIITKKTIRDIVYYPDKGYYNELDVILPQDIQYSKDKNAYILTQDSEMGRGWAILLQIDENGNKKILQQDHRDNIREFLLDGEWIKSFGIDYSVVW